MNVSKPFFSVVLPLYNKQEYVKRTIDSVLGQNFEDFEIVVVNDGSTDKSVEVIEAIIDSRVRIVHKRNEGVSAARNAGIREARADYIVFLDADDLWMPQFLQTVRELIFKYPSAGIFATAYDIHAGGKIRKLNTNGLPDSDFEGVIPNYFKVVANGDLIVWTSAVCVPKKIFYDNDIWFPVGESRGEDQFVWARIALHFDVAYSCKVMARYNLYTSNSTSGSACDFYEPRQFLLDLKLVEGTKGGREASFWLEKFLVREVFNVVKRNIFNGRRMLAVRQLRLYDLPFLLRCKLLAYLLVPKFLYEFFSVSVRNCIRYRRVKFI